MFFIESIVIGNFSVQKDIVQKLTTKTRKTSPCLRGICGTITPHLRPNTEFILGASPRRGDRAIRLYLFSGPTVSRRKKGYRFYPLRVLISGRTANQTRSSAS
jgi:hypothetical protein